MKDKYRHVFTFVLGITLETIAILAGIMCIYLAFKPNLLEELMRVPVKRAYLMLFLSPLFFLEAFFISSIPVEAYKKIEEVKNNGSR